MVAARAAHPTVVQQLLPPTAPQTLAQAHRVLDHAHAVLARGGVRDRSLHRGAHGEARADGRGQTDRSHRDRQPRDTDRHSRGAGVRRDRAEPIRPPRVGLPPPEGPPLARARPPAARHTGRATLPSAIYPHTLPVARKVSSPNGPNRIAALPRRATPESFESIKVVTCARQPNSDCVTSAAV